ncbi:MAG: hypothetical protein HQ575_00855 [Candidatus Omnitrophica bacterium]|nr:hypothetical protein [Candidatus Omnitrophota bacterium]
MHKSFNKSRLFVVFIVFISILTFYLTRIIYLQIFKSKDYSIIADNQHNILLQIEPQRGDIYDRNLRKMAIDCKVDSVYAVPIEMPGSDKGEIAANLSRLLDLNEDMILARLNQEKSFVWIKREVDKDTSERIEDLNLKSVRLLKEHKRFYPNGPLASHLIGFTGIDDTGLEGIELLYDGYLRGTPGWRWTVRDAKRRDIISEDVKFIPPSDGLSVVLTIDEAMQHIAENSLDEVFKKYKAKAASIIVMDPHNGDILALASRPSFNPNEFSTAGADLYRNRCVTDMYEPGSVFKVFTAACAIEEGLVDINQNFFCEDGEYRIAGRILHDHKPLGTLTFREVIEKSSNIGVCKIAEIIGKERLYKFIKLFGFGELTGADIPGEIEGIVRRPSEWSAVSISSVPIGQEIAVTSMQLVTAVSAIANGGYLMKPRVVREVRDSGGNIIKSFDPAIVRQVISTETADIIKDIMKGVVESGTGGNARLEGYTTAGKTGTAQKVEAHGGYSHTKFVASFVGFAPAVDPRITILVTVDEPRPVYYGGSVAAPVFRDAARDILRYMKIEYDKPGGAVKL